VGIDRTPTYLSFAEVMADWEDSRVFELEEAIAELRASSGWTGLMELLEAGREKAVRAMGEGPTLTGRQYARNVGWLSGLVILPEVAEAVLAHAELRREQLRELEKMEDSNARR
jgi:hypothetical protein